MPLDRPTSRARLELCGGLRMFAGDRPVDVDVLGGRRGRRALEQLVLMRGQPITRDGLATVLWPDDLPTTWQSALRTALSRVRDAFRELGIADDALDTALGTLRLRLPLDVAVDLFDAERDARLAEDILADVSPGTYADAIRVAAGAARTLAAPLVPDAEGDWIDAARRAAHLTRMRALDALAAARLAVDEFEDAIAVAEESIAVEPLRESSYRVLMEAHGRAGRRGDALRAYERVRSLLADELGVAPSDQTEAAYLRLLDVSGWKPDPSINPSRSSPLPSALIARDELPFVGRATALATLNEWWTSGPAGVGGTHLAEVTGEPGIGKSRLTRELARMLHAEGVRVLHVQFDEDATGGLEPLLRLVGDAELIDDQHDRDAVIDDIVARLMDESVAAPALLILDDMQWARRPVVTLVQRLVRADAGRIGVLATVRDGEIGPHHPMRSLRASAIRAGSHREVALSGLEVADVTDLLRAVERDGSISGFAHVERRRQPRLDLDAEDDGSHRIAAELWDRTAGNPLYVGESLRHLVVTGQLGVDEAGRWAGSVSSTSTSGIGTIAAPTVRDLVLARVGALEGGVADVLTVAAVLGTSFELSVLGACVDGGLEHAVDAVDTAIRAQVVRALPDKPGCCRFVHGVIHATLVDALSAPKRMALHRRVGIALEARPGSTDAIELARHFLEAAPLGDVERAGRYAVTGARAAIAALAYEDAADIAHRGLALPVDNALRSALLLVLGRSGIDAGDSADAHRAYVDAFHVARSAGDATTMGLAALGASRGFTGGSEWMPEAQRRALVAEALSVVPEDETALRVELLSQLALWTPEPDERQRLASAAMAATERDPSPDALVAAYGASRIALWRPTDVRARIEFAGRVSAAAIGRGDHVDAAGTDFGTVGDLIQLGDRTAATALLADLDGRDAVRRSRRLRWQRALWRAVDAFADGRLIDVEEASTAALAVWGDDEHVDATQAWGNQLALLRVLQNRGGELIEPMEAWLTAAPSVEGFRAGLAWALAQSGRADEATAHLEALLGAGLPQDNTFPTTWIAAAHACHLVGAASLAQHLLAEGDALHGQLVFQPGPALFVGPADHALGLLAGLVGDRAAAVNHLRAAQTLAARCGQWWVERSERALADLR